MQIVNVSNPAAFGAEWTAEHGTYQLVNPRGTSSLWFGAKCGDGAWQTTTVVNPERFGMRAAPKNSREFMAIARAFVVDE